MSELDIERRQRAVDTLMHMEPGAQRKWAVNVVDLVIDTYLDIPVS